MIGRTILAFIVAVLLVQQQRARPPAGGPGPWDNDVQVYRVDRFGRVEWLATFPRAGVATIARLADGRLVSAYQSFPEGDPSAFDKVAVRYSLDEGKTWTESAPIVLSGWPANMRPPFDPTLVPLPDRRIRLYFTSVDNTTRDVPAIYSAISTDGFNFETEPGRRFGVDGKPVIDCAVALHRGTFHLFAPRSEELGFGYHATSTDGLTFKREEDVKMDGERRWLGAAVSDGGSLVFFGTGEPDAPGPRLPSAIGAQPPAGAPRPAPSIANRDGGIWTATSRNGQSWQPATAPPIPGADPGVVASNDGGWVVVVTGPPRDGTASARRNAPPAPAALPTPAPALGGGPRNHRLVLASSADGLAWTLSPNTFAERASAPALFEGPDGRLIVLYVDASGARPPGGLSARVERADGTWESRDTNLRGADPSVVHLRDGSFRAYTREPDGSVAVFMSPDGLDWTRFGTAYRDPEYPNTTDPDVFQTGTGWVMLLSLGPRLVRATSKDGLSFTTTGVADLGGSGTNTVIVPGGWRTYFHVVGSAQGGGDLPIIRSAFTSDGAGWRVDAGSRLMAPTERPAAFGVSDPAPAHRSSGSWVMLVTTFIEPPRR